MNFLILNSIVFAQSDLLQQRVSSALSEAIVEHLSVVGKTPDVEIKSLGLNPNHDCVGQLTPRISFSKHENFQGILNVTAEVFDSSGRCGRWRFHPEVAIWLDVPVATTTTQAGTEVLFELKRSRYDKIHGTLVDANSGPWMARKTLKKGQALTIDLLRKMPTNFDGDKVKLLVENNNFSIKAEGKLMSDAYIGQQVKVLSFVTSTVINGVLTSPGTVKVGDLR